MPQTATPPEVRVRNDKPFHGKEFVVLNARRNDKIVMPRMAGVLNQQKEAQRSLNTHYLRSGKTYSSGAHRQFENISNTLRSK